ncbi:hypothetical protein SNE40_015562 [Patella caerulea]|uniref:C-type lectin domain-containing protein n=1 Tax=Patella caerulea TaxID=87958 RepID=A0AAN8JK61_PATCE
MDYSVSFEDISLTKCSMQCASHPGCKLFHYDGDSTCYILNMVDKGLDSVDIQTLHVDQSLNERCNNLSGYLSLTGGVFCIKVFRYGLNWMTAKARCEQDGGNLVIIKQTELSLKMEAIKTLDIRPGIFYWIGLNDIGEEGKMIWVDGSTLDTNVWAPGEPNNSYGSEDCCTIVSHYWLNDQSCSAPHHFVCELPFMFTF